MDKDDLSDHDLLIRVDSRLNTVERVVWGILGAVGLAALGFFVDLLQRLSSHGAG